MRIFVQEKCPLKDAIDYLVGCVTVPSEPSYLAGLSQIKISH